MSYELLGYTSHVVSLTLSTPLSKVLRTTQDHVKVLQEMGMTTVEDLLHYLPRSHEDLSQIQTLSSVPLDTKVTIRGAVSALKLVRTRHGKVLVQGLLTDSDGAIAHLTWFNQPHIMRMLKDGDEVVLTGKVSEQGYKLTMSSPKFEVAGLRPLLHAGRLVPIYPQHAIITTKWLREKMALVQPAIDLLPETLPEELLTEENLLSRAQTIRALHFPENPEEVLRALDRKAFEEMYLLQKDALERKAEGKRHRSERIRVPMDVELIRALFASLKFTPTGSQKIAIYEILKDMERDEPMSRLLEGDVGSGKTLVAASVMANVMRHGGQCALMVPTEVLARQHAQNITRLMVNFWNYLGTHGASTGVTRMPVIALLTGSTPGEEANAIRRSVATGTVDLLIGTHALIEDTVQFHDLKLVIVDEQHRFGVRQRERLSSKGNPHVLAMTATPIPRTLALTAYGHHDLSVLLEKPGNRKEIATKVVSPQDRITVERFIDHQIGEGRQVFVICPLITQSTSEGMEEVRSVERESERLKEAFPRRRITLLHGKLTSAEKEKIMADFKAQRSDILVSTSVIEVGIDIPNATIICIEGAERFGLSQLHQFRGRVGRSDHQSHCFLFTSSIEQARSERLKAMEKHSSGFMLAEIDLKLRGPGELFGLRQSGIPESMYGMIMNPEIIVRARRAAEKWMKKSG